MSKSDTGDAVRRKRKKPTKKSTAGKWYHFLPKGWDCPDHPAEL